MQVSKLNMAKQPYIPFYLGDYLKDTRILPLNVRGGWVDLILYMWDNKVRGELVGTYDDFARLMTCSKDEAILVIQTLNQKKIFDYAELSNGMMKIESRKMKAMKELSEKRKKSGKEGGNPLLLKKSKNKGYPKRKNLVKQKPEYEYEDKNEVECIISLEECEKLFFDDFEIQRMSFQENGFNQKQLAQSLTEFWNTKKLDPETTVKPYSDIKKHYLNWCRQNKTRLKNENNGKQTRKGQPDTENVVGAAYEHLRKHNLKINNGGN